MRLYFTDAFHINWKNHGLNIEKEKLNSLRYAVFITKEHLKRPEIKEELKKDHKWEQTKNYEEIAWATFRRLKRILQNKKEDKTYMKTKILTKRVMPILLCEKVNHITSWTINAG